MRTKDRRSQGRKTKVGHKRFKLYTFSNVVYLPAYTAVRMTHKVLGIFRPFRVRYYIFENIIRDRNHTVLIDSVSNSFLRMGMCNILTLSYRRMEMKTRNKN